MRVLRNILFAPLLIAGVLFCIQSVTAQNSSITSNLKSAESRADAFYAKGAYGEAVVFYRQVLEKDPNNLQAMLRIAESYSIMNEQDQAVVWYAKIMEKASPIEPAHKLKYAQALASAGNYQKAKSWYESYLVDVPDDRRAKYQLTAIAQADLFYADSASYQIKKLKINTAHPEFGPAFYDEGLVFVSAREVKKPVKWVNTAGQSAFYDLYFGKINEHGELSESGKLQQELNSRYHEGPVAFFENGNRILFTQNSFQNSRSKGVTKRLALFEAERSKEGNAWINIKPLPYNSDSYSVAHPTIRPDGELLYFASDMPGGYGQSDIYVCRRQNGSWSKPENLGPSVNTEGNEMFPYLHNNTLFFASNGLGGLGGLDIFKLELNKTDKTPKNLGVPVNSSKDDFGLILNDKNTGYFSTNRIKENKDDLYWVKYIQHAAKTLEKPLAAVKPFTSRLQGFIFEKESNAPLSKAQIYIINEVTGEELNLTADERGYFTFDARLEDSYAIMGEKEEKNVFAINITAKDFSEQNKLIKLEASTIIFPKKIVIETSLYDSLTNEPVVFAGAYLFEGAVELQKDYTSLDGKAYFSAMKGNNYWIDIITINYTDKKYKITNGLQAVNDTLKVAVPLQKIKRTRNLVQGNFYNEETGKAIANADIFVLNEITGDQQTLISDTKGDFKFEAKTGDTYLFMGEKEDLHAFIPDVLIRDPYKFPNDIIRLKASSPQFVRDIIVEAVVVDSITQLPLRLAEVKFTRDGKESRLFTSSNGKVFYQLSQNQLFTAKTSLKDYQDYIFSASTGAASPNDTLRITLPLKKVQLNMVAVQGYVYDKKTNKPVDQASIYLFNTKTGEEVVAISNSAGVFECKGYPAVSYLIVGEKDNKSVFITDFTFKDPALSPTPKLELAIEKPVFGNKKSNHSLLEALIIDRETREPIKFTFIKLIRAGEILDNAFTDETGKVRLPLEKDTNYELQSEKPNFSDQSIQISTLNQADTISVVMELNKVAPKIVSISGSVYDKQAGEPLALADVYILDINTGDQTQVVADTDGNFTFPAIAAHSYTVIAEKGHKAANFPEFKAELVPANIQLVVQPAKPREVIIAATVLDKNTKEPVKAASLKLLANTTEKGSAYSSMKGKSWLAAATEDEMELSISAHNFIPQSIRISTKSPSLNDTILVEVLLQPYEPVIVSKPVLFSDDKGKPIPNANVFLLNKKSGEEINLTTDAKGSFVYKSKPAEVFSILAEKDEFVALLTNVATKENSDTLKLVAISPAKQDVYTRVIAKDKATGEPVKFLEIQIAQDEQEIRKVYTSLKGEVLFKALPEENYTFKTSHINYSESARNLLINKQDQDTVTVEFFLEKVKPLYTTLQVQVSDEKTKRPIPAAEVWVVNETTGEELVLLANENGELPMKAKYSDSYTISILSDIFESSGMSGVKAVEDDGLAKNYIQLKAVRKETGNVTSLSGSIFDVIEVSSGNQQLFVSFNGELYEYVIAGDSVLLRSQSNIRVLAKGAREGKGESLYSEFTTYIDSSSINSRTYIRSIFYDFNKASLNAEAKEELVKISETMKAYPDLLLKIRAFTDSRGTDTYNAKLSKQRALAARNYLISLGIDSNRITSEGLGEKILLKPCPKPQDCNQKDHQLNRRGEFILNIKN